jgi:hypothetical protein|tara:strand:+ start:1504 stop:2949 length:1446 start_codon:yes stop_codon:yes gene_type:complete
MANLDYWYDAQLRRYLTQFMRIFGDFKVAEGKRAGSTFYNKVPVRYADMSRMVAHILRKGSENMVNSTPFIACSINSLLIARDRAQDPMLVSKVQVSERQYDTGAASYKTDAGSQKFPGNLYTTDRYMPVPYNLTMQVDIWSGNTDQKLQIMEQILVLFNPSIQLQSSTNPLDWTSIFEVELTDIAWSNRSVPAGVDETIDVATLTFTLPIWISPPAKVKRQKIINTIITNIYDTSSVDDMGYDEDIYDFFRTLESDFELHTVSPNNYFLQVEGTEATLFKSGPTEGTSYDDGVTTKANWNDLLASISQQGSSGTLSNAAIQISDIPLTTGSTLQLNLSNDIDSVTSLVSGFIARNSIDPSKLVFTVDSDTLPTATLTNITKIVDPTASYPGDGTLDTATNGQRYLLTAEISGSQWGISADVNDIVEYNGSAWTKVFDASAVTDIHYVTNTYTGKQYKWQNETWTSTFEGTYNPGYWKINI